MGPRPVVVDILSPWLAVGVTVVAIAVPVALALWAGMRGSHGWLRRVGRGVGVLLVVALCQALALSAVFFHVNDTYAFFTSWDELIGEAPAAPTHDLVAIHQEKVRKIPITSSNPHPDGLMAGIRMPGTDRSRSHVPVWLPPQYFERSQSRTRFPVLYWIGGVNDTGDHDNIAVPITGPSLNLIKKGKVNPYVIVFLPGEIRAGQDTECTNVDGIDHQSWILDTVIPKVEKHYRVGRTRDSRFIAGWSTGGYCAANFATRYAARFKAGFGLAPYFHPTYSEPLLAKVPRSTILENSPLHWVKERKVPADTRFLSVMSKLDRSSWGDVSDPPMQNGQIMADGQDFWNRAHTMKQYSFIVLPSGGHHPGTYIPYIPQCLRWLGQYGL